MSKKVQINDIVSMEFPDNMSEKAIEKIKQQLIQDVAASLTAAGQTPKEKDND